MRSLAAGLLLPILLAACAAPGALPPRLHGDRHGERTAGRLLTDTLASAALGGRRAVTAYLPPGHRTTHRTPVVFLGDGERVPDFARALEGLIAAGQLRPTLLVGAHADPAARAAEYLVGYEGGAGRFAAHERFFVEELGAWAERTLGASGRAGERAVFGFSNGADFALAMGLRHPDRYGHVLAFSPGWTTVSEGAALEGAPRFFLFAGTLDPPFRAHTSAVARRLEAQGAVVHHVERVAGHDLAAWVQAFQEAVAWSVGRP